MTTDLTYSSPTQLETIALINSSSINGGKCAVATVETKLVLAHPSSANGIDRQYHRCKVKK